MKPKMGRLVDREAPGRLCCAEGKRNRTEVEKRGGVDVKVSGVGRGVAIPKVTVSLIAEAAA